MANVSTARALGYFSRVKEAREYLRDQAKELLELQKALIMEAAAKGEIEAALKANQWLIEHMPAGDEGERVIDPSASKPKEIEGPKGPMIAVGVHIGGVSKQIPAQIIDIKPEPNE